MAAAGAPPQSTERRDKLQEMELEVQKKWEAMKIFEVDAGEEGEEKFFVTFPYPYMNGILHLGHAYSLTKAIFAAQFHRLLGKKVLFPFGFHCTGMPIQAAANKLAREYQVYATKDPVYPIFPPGRPQTLEKAELHGDQVDLIFKAPSSTGNLALKEFVVLLKKGEDLEEVGKVAAPSPEQLKAAGNKVTCRVRYVPQGVYKARAVLADGTVSPEGKESDPVSLEEAQDAKGKGKGKGKPKVAKKIAAKTGDATFQWEILKAMGIDPKDMQKFSKPEYWLEYFPPLGIRDLKRFGTPIDFRRSFITTSVNAYYDSFIRWQFRKLKAGQKIGFGKRPTIFSEADGQACMDHDRKEGEGVVPQEYTAVKIKLLEFPECMAPLKDKNVFLLAATLRPETMPGQTNCWILPEGTYGCYKASDADVYVCSARAARNMSFQEILAPVGKPELLMQVAGKALMGCKIKCPTAKFEFCHLLPMLTIKMDKGTGIVTSVPSDSPDDYAAFRDLQKKPDYFGIKAEWVKNFEPVPIIDVEIDGEVRTMAAEYTCIKEGVTSQKDTEKLQRAHDTCYQYGFSFGKLSCGPYKGKSVQEAKVPFRNDMIKAGEAFLYSEPEKKVVSRSDDECVVAGIDQWFLKYGDEPWKNAIKAHMGSQDFRTYNTRIKESFEYAVNWLSEWACSRSFGLGTKVPWDEQFVIESLSDSTIYMAYYTVCHFLQDKSLDGKAGSSLSSIKPEDLTDEVWDYIYVGGEMPASTQIPKDLLKKMRNEFKFWYPMDLRCSGKDLIYNHLTMCMYNHACVWEDDVSKWPRGFFCNGMSMVNGEKMSKSLGNFFTLQELINKYSADAARIAAANCGDTLEDGNFEETVAEKALLNMPVFLKTMGELVEGKTPLDDAPADRTFLDRWFANEMNRLLNESRKHYETMYYREALRTAYYEFQAVLAQYTDTCNAGKRKMNKTLTMRFLEWQMIILSPIAPHFCEHGWGLLGKSGSVLNAKWPAPTAAVDAVTVAQGVYMYDKVPHDFIKLLEKASKNGRPTSASVYVALTFPDWKVTVLEKLRARHAKGALPLVTPEELKDSDEHKAQWKACIEELMQDAALKPFAKLLGPFAAFKRDEAAELGPRSLDASVPFDELALVKESVEYLKDKLGMDVEVRLAAEPKAPAHGDSAALAQPGKPSVVYDGAAGGAAAGGKAKGGAGPAAAKGKPTNGAAPAVIKDLKALNDHLSTRSYVEGGAGPTAGDAAQLGALPGGSVSAEQYPHVARWQSHIGSFAPEARAKW